MISPQIVEAREKLIVGIRKEMSLTTNKTAELWREFQPQVSKIPNRVGKHLFSLQTYPENYFQAFNPSTTFEKWAAGEVSTHSEIPENMERFVVPGGMYAVFHYVGSSAEAPKLFQFIYGEWLPKSKYLLDHRPHFELLDEKYRNNDPTSEEDVWIPVRPK